MPLDESLKQRILMTTYQDFIDRKSQLSGDTGFDPLWMPDFLYGFQQMLVEWAILKGRAAIFADCGLGKSPMQLVWAENIVRKTNGRVLILTPLAVGPQAIRESEKFGIEAQQSRDGNFSGKIIVTNYEQIEKFSPDDFEGIVCDESSILKNVSGKRKAQITEFMRTRPYRLLCTATAAPNDYNELGTSSEALGYLGYQDMLGRFFKQMTSKDHLGWGRTKYRLKEHTVTPFWRWICSWARSIRRPSDYGFDDGAFSLPDLIVDQMVIENTKLREGMLFVTPAVTMQEQREERRMTIQERCERVAEMVNHGDSSVSWCHLNDEGDLLTKLISGAVQVSGKDSDEAKEEKLLAFSSGELKKLVTKPKIAGFGLNWQHCSHMTTFPSHSFEQYYQTVRRFWRFGQTRDVTVNIVTTLGEEKVLANLTRKSNQADEMFDQLLANMKNALQINRLNSYDTEMEPPPWL